MINQCYLKCNMYYIFVCAYIPVQFKNIVLLLQGYSHSITDIDYFMSNVKNELIDNECAVVQFDPYGHGDSDGNLEDFQYDTLKENIITVVNWIEKNWKVKPLLVTRGLYTSLANDEELAECFAKKIFLNPPQPEMTEILELKKYLTNIKGTIDFSEWFSKIPNHQEEFFESFFYTLGAKLKNLQGQHFQPEYLLNFLDKLTCRSNSLSNLYLISKDKRNVRVCKKKEEIEDCSLEYWGVDGALPRDPEWHDCIIDIIVNLCVYQGVR